MATTPAVHQVNLLPPPLLQPQERGDYLASTPTGDEEPYDMRETLRSLASWKKHKLCLSMSYYYTNTKSTRKERQAYSLLQTTMEPLPHGLWSCSSKPLTGRTGYYRLRDASVYWNYIGDITTAWYTGILLHRTRTRCTTTTCLVGYTPLKATPAPAATNTSQETTDFASHLVFASQLDIQDYTGHQE